MKKIRSKQIAVEAARIARNKKSKGIIVLDVRRHANYCNYFTIATVESLPQMNAVENEIVARMKDYGILRFTSQHMPSRPPSPAWRVIDFGGAVIHVMTPESRKFYSLEKILARAKKVPLSAPAAKRSPRKKARVAASTAAKKRKHVKK
jgi:ribosome-associated protein